MEGNAGELLTSSLALAICLASLVKILFTCNELDRLFTALQLPQMDLFIDRAFDLFLAVRM